MIGAPEYRGPFPTSNWIIPKRVLWGDSLNAEKVHKLNTVGVNVIVDLRRDGAPPTGSDAFYVNFPIANYMTGTPAHVDALRNLTSAILNELSQPNNVVYIHCQDGAGASALLASGIVAGQHGVTGLKAMNMTSQMHSCRDDTRGADGLFPPNLKTLVRETFTSYTPSQEVTLDQFVSAPGGGGVTESKGSKGPVAPLDAMECTQSSMSGTQRFQNTKGHGGGETTFNIYESNATPVGGSPNTQQKVGRKFVQGYAPGGGGAQSVRLFDQTLSGVSNAPSSNLSSPSRGAPNAFHQQPPPTPKPNEIIHPKSSPQPKSVISTVTRFRLNRKDLSIPWGIDVDGLRVIGTIPGSVAHNANLIPGDIVAINGLDVTSEEQLSLLAEFTDVELHIRGPTGGDGGFGAQPPSSAMSSRSSMTGSNPNLPPLLDPRRDQSAIKGPTPTSNWVIRGAILCGSKPNSKDKKKFLALLDQGITVFVNLMEDADCSYIEAAESSTHRAFQALCFPIADGGVPPPTQIPHFRQFIEDVIAKIYEGHVLYIHCLEGHGRTGIVVSILLAKLYNMPAMKAISLCSNLHKGRVDDCGQDSPANVQQRTFVQTFLQQ
eukprot:PhF_6_TR42807/c0_g1_i1/m.64804